MTNGKVYVEDRLDAIEYSPTLWRVFVEGLTKEEAENILRDAPLYWTGEWYGDKFCVESYQGEK